MEGWLFQLPQKKPIPGGSRSLSLLTTSWQNALPTPWESSTHLLRHIQVLPSNSHPESTMDENPGVLGCIKNRVASRLRRVILPLCLALVITSWITSIQLCRPQLRKDMDHWSKSRGEPQRWIEDWCACHDKGVGTRWPWSPLQPQALDDSKGWGDRLTPAGHWMPPQNHYVPPSSARWERENIMEGSWAEIRIGRHHPAVPITGKTYFI